LPEVFGSLENYDLMMFFRDTRWRGWLRHRTASRKVSLEFFINTSLPAALWSWIDSASNKWVSRIFPGDKGGRCL